MSFDGIMIASLTIGIIGLFHPLVVKGEYYFSKRIWPVFLVFGIVCVICSLFISNNMLSAALAVIGASSFWSIHELFEQEKRVDKGWFPEGPGHIKVKEEE